MQHLAGRGSGVFLVFVNRRTIDEGVNHTGGGHYQAFAAAGQIIFHRAATRRADRSGIEDRDIGIASYIESAATFETEEIRRLRSDPFDCVLERDCLRLAYPMAEQVSAVARIAKQIDVSAGVRQSDHRARIIDQLAEAL